MTVYLLNVVVIGLLYFFIYHSRTPKRRFLQLSLAYLFIISSFRDQSIGADYEEYVQAFQRIRQTGSYYMEEGYVLLNRIVGLFTSQYIGIAIAVNLIIFIPLYYFIKNQINEKYWGVCIAVFLFNPYMFIQTTFNAMRQGCATGIILIGMSILYSRKKRAWSVLFYFISIIIAYFFHRISLVMAVIPIVLRINWKKQHWIIAVCIALILNLVGVRYIGTIVTTLLRLRKGYLNYGASLLNNPVYVAFILVFIVFLLMHYDAYTQMEPRKKRLIDFYLFSLCFLIAALPNDMFYRTYIILGICALPGLPVLCECTELRMGKKRIKNESHYLKILVVLYYFCFYMGYIMYLASKSNSNYIPFRFFFS